MFKRLFSFFLSLVFSATAAARTETIVEPFPIFEQKQQVVELKKDLFLDNGISQFFIKKALKAQLYMPTAIGTKNTLSKTGSVVGHFALNTGMNMGISGLQSTLIGAATILAVATMMNCEEKKIRSQEGCLKPEVIAQNFAVASKFMLTNNEFLTGMISGFASGPALTIINYLIKDAAGIRLFHRFLISGVQSIVAFLGFSFGMQLWKEAVHLLPKEDQEHSEGLIARVITNPAGISEQDSKLFKDISKIMTLILYKAPELRELLIYNWWRLEISSGKGVSAIASMIPAMMYGIQGAGSGAKAGARSGPATLLIMSALGFAGGLAAALIPQETLREMTLVSQNLRNSGYKMDFLKSNDKFEQLFRAYARDPEGKGLFGQAKPDVVLKKRLEIFKSLLDERQNLRENFGTIVYEKVYDAQILKDQILKSVYTAKVTIDDAEMREALRRSFAINQEGKFTFAEASAEKPECHQAPLMMVKPQANKNVLSITPFICTRNDEDDLWYQKNIVAKGKVLAEELTDFIAEQIVVLNKFYDKESSMLEKLHIDNYEALPLEINTLIESERRRVKLVRSMNYFTIFGLIDPKAKENPEYIEASGDLVSFMRNSSYSEDVLLKKLSDEAKKRGKSL